MPFIVDPDGKTRWEKTPPPQPTKRKASRKTRRSAPKDAAQRAAEEKATAKKALTAARIQRFRRHGFLALGMAAFYFFGMYVFFSPEQRVGWRFNVLQAAFFLCAVIGIVLTQVSDPTN